MDEVCSACLEGMSCSEGEIFKMRCNHTIHAKCLEKLIRHNCPLCNDELSYLSPTMFEVILENAKKYKRDIEQINEDRLRELLFPPRQDPSENNEDEDISEMPMHIEALLAVSYFVYKKYPLNAIPIHFFIDAQPANVSPRPPTGVVFNTIVSSVKQYIINRLDQFIEEDEVGSDDPSAAQEDDSDENPFIDDTAGFEAIRRGLYFTTPRNRNLQLLPFDIKRLPRYDPMIFGVW